MDTSSARSAVLLGFGVHFILGAVSNGGADPAGLSRCAILCLTAAWRALARVLGGLLVVMISFMLLTLFLNVSVQISP